MVSFGAIRVDESLATTFYGQVHPITESWIPEALSVSGISRDEHLRYDDPPAVMAAFASWLGTHSAGKPLFLSSNVAFHWQFINYYFHRFSKANPFGFSGRRIGDLYSGLVKDLFAASDWKKLRKTKHTHNPVDDVKGNAEALLALAKQYGLRLPK